MRTLYFLVVFLICRAEIAVLDGWLWCGSFWVCTVDVKRGQNAEADAKSSRPSQGRGMVWYGIVEFNVPLDTV